MLASKYHPYKRQGGQAARCLCCVRSTPADSTGWVEVHVEGEEASYRSGQSLEAIGQVTAQMAEVIAACSKLVPQQVPLAHRSCARAAAAAFAVGKRLRGQEPLSQLQPMPCLCSTPTQAPAHPGPAHAPCPHHLPDQPPSHPSQSQLQGSSQHHPALSAPLHLPGLSILTRPATNPVTSPAKEQQPIIHTTEEQDEQTMPPSMPKQQQDWATARPFSSSPLAPLPEEQGPSPSPSPPPPAPPPAAATRAATAQHSAPHTDRGRGRERGRSRGRGRIRERGRSRSGPAPPTHDPATHAENQQPQQQEPCKRRKRGSTAGPRDKHTERMGQEVMEVFERCGSADQQAQLLDRVLTSPQLPVAVQQAMQQCPTTKQRVACLLLDRVQLLMDSGTCGKKGGQHTDDVTARRVLARLVPPELLEQQLVSAFAQQTGLDRHWVSEAARQNLEQRACIQDRVDSLRHFAAVSSPDNRGHQGISQAVFDFIRHHYHERSKPSPSCKDQRSYWVCLHTGDDESTLVKETRRFFESSLLVMWREFDDEQQHLEEQWRQNQHQQGGQLQQPPSMRVSLSTFVRLRPPWVARLTASQRQVCVCKTCCNLDNLLTALAKHKKSLQLPAAATIAAPLAAPLAAVGAAPQPPPHQGGDAPLVAEEEDDSLTAAASPYIDPLDGSVMLIVRQYGKPSSAVGSRPAPAAGKAKVELLCMRVSLSDVVGMLNKQMPEYIRHHRLAHHQLQVFREHREAVKAGQDGKVVISCDWSEKLTVERSVEIMPSITKPFEAMPMFDQKRDDKHWDDECLTLLCSFAPDSVKQLCTLGKKLSVKMLNEYCKAVGLCVPANTLRADLRYMVLQHLNEQAEWD
ncbi:hypothetical protein QJQ45_007018 [Haematococcus lacustris]|nr:hypothetical protein QJQ45_007018 [Haematococcus lacustris]